MTAPRKRRIDRAIAAALMVAAWIALAGGPARGGTTQTTTTTYVYNADGAPTAVTTQVGTQPATTAYLTWDNFTPNTAAPATGTLSAADGNLVGVGASPGTTGLTTQFTYDVRDRLTACSPLGQSAASYTYHPTSLMASSSLASGDALQFYYDNTATPLMVNTSQPSTGLVSSFLGPVRYLSDGTEQVLLQPRKDTAGVYDATAQTLSSFAYDPYGAPWSGSATAASGLSSDGTSYDLTQNAFQYAGEYKDPTCSAYYLRARWYLPAQQTFLSRDPADLLHRFNYTAGNPVGRTDPSGLKFTGEDFSHDVDKAVDKLTPGVWAYVEPVLPVWGQALGGIELVGLLPSFWHHPTAEGGITFGFLAASIVSEAGAEAPQVDQLPIFRSNPVNAFRGRLGIDLALGASQTAAQSDRHGRIDVPALIQGVDSTLYGMFWARGSAGIGYRPYGVTMDDVDEMARAHVRDVNNVGQALVFRLRPSGHGEFTSPLMEQFHIGNYHEAVFAISRDTIWQGEVGLRGDTYTWETTWSREAATLNQPSRFFGSTNKRLIAVGRFSQSAVGDAFRSAMDLTQQDVLARNATGRTISSMPDYNKLFNNCQHSAARVRANILNFQGLPRAGRNTM